MNLDRDNYDDWHMPSSQLGEANKPSRGQQSPTGPTRMEDFVELIPSELMDASGAAFYAGRRAFETPSNLYMLGMNPAGSSIRQSGETVKWHCNKVMYNEPDNWSAYGDESWEGAKPGTWRIQPRVLSLLHKLGLNPGAVPASNLVFLRSPIETEVHGDFDELAERCWAFHQAVLDRLGTKVILCFGKTTGDWVRTRLDAHEQVRSFVEETGRRWTSRAYKNADQLTVVVATHPSRVDWRVRGTDPTRLVREALDRV